MFIPESGRSNRRRVLVGLRRQIRMRLAIQPAYFGNGYALGSNAPDRNPITRTLDGKAQHVETNTQVADGSRRERCHHV